MHYINKMKFPQYFRFELFQFAYILYAFSTKVTATNKKKQKQPELIGSL